VDGSGQQQSKDMIEIEDEHAENANLKKWIRLKRIEYEDDFFMSVCQFLYNENDIKFHPLIRFL
jgi:hypothetical protein